MYIRSYMLPPAVFHQQTLDCIFMRAELPALHGFMCASCFINILKAYDVFEQSHRCFGGFIYSFNDVFLLHLNTIIQDEWCCLTENHSRDRHRQTERDAGKWNLFAWHVGDCACVGEDDRTAQSEIENSWLTPYSWSMSSGLSRKSGYPVITIMCFSWERRKRRESEGEMTGPTSA